MTNLEFDVRELSKSVSTPWIKHNLEETCREVMRGKRFRYTVLRVLKSIAKRVFYKALYIAQRIVHICRKGNVGSEGKEDE
jgi:rhamnan synthesis protein F